MKLREALLERPDDAGGVLDRQRRLGDEAKGRRVRRREARRVRLGLDQGHSTFRQLAHRADHFRVAGMADQEHVAAEPLMAHRLLVHFRHQRTGSVEIKEITGLGVGRHRFRHAMRGKDDRRLPMLGRDLGEFLDEHRAQALQPLDDVAVVHDLVADIDRRAVFLQRQHNDLDGAVDARAKAARLAEPDRQRWLFLNHQNGPVQSESWRRNGACTPALSRAAAFTPPSPGGGA